MSPQMPPPWAPVVLIGLVGPDDAGTAVRKLIAGITAVMPALVTRQNGPTTVKTRVVARHQQIGRLDSELIGAPSRDEARQILAELGRVLGEVDAVLLSDYGKGVLIGDIAEKAIRMVRDAGKPIIVDPKGHDYSIYRGADLITPKLRELHEATLLPVDSDDSVVCACRTLITDNTIGAVIATRGPQGMSIVTEAAALHLPTVAREVFDVSGAGRYRSGYPRLCDLGEHANRRGSQTGQCCGGRRGRQARHLAGYVKRTGH
jgi:D-beta-D-heptose 7-phosphate kinase / D-beta-D-heptose 1-phosphate adenosyltransferase